MSYREGAGLNKCKLLFEHVVTIITYLSFMYLNMLSILCNIIIFCMIFSVFFYMFEIHLNQSINQSKRCTVVETL
jgi:uncharacterized membrane protein